jgi:hypothetical protein
MEPRFHRVGALVLAISLVIGMNLALGAAVRSPTALLPDIFSGPALSTATTADAPVTFIVRVYSLQTLPRPDPDVRSPIVVNGRSVLTLSEEFNGDTAAVPVGTLILLHFPNPIPTRRYAVIPAAGVVEPVSSIYHTPNGTIGLLVARAPGIARVVVSVVPGQSGARRGYLAQVGAPPPVAGGITSPTWSGMILTTASSSFTAVSGTWTIPSPAGGQNPLACLSSWVGIDGFTGLPATGAGGPSVIQAGVDQGPLGVFAAWVETFPNPTQYLARHVYPVFSGDSVGVNISKVAPGQWSIILSDETQGWDFSTTVNYSGPGATAEWIGERYSAPFTPCQLLNYGTIPFGFGGVTAILVNPPGPSTSTTAPFTFNVAADESLVPLSMVENGVTVSTPSTPDGDGDGFTLAFGATPPSPPGPIITTTALPNASVSQQYTQALTATGGTGTLSWSIADGTLPNGLGLIPLLGQITGIPSECGTESFSAVVTDSTGAWASTPLSLTVTAPPLQIPSVQPQFGMLPQPAGDLPPGDVGVAYFGQETPVSLTATGGCPPYTWSVPSGSLPPGMALNPAGYFVGTPTQSGSFSLVVSITDNGANTAQATFTLTVQASLAISTTSLATAIAGQQYNQTVNATGGTGGYYYHIQSGSLPPGLNFGSTGHITGTASSLSSNLLTFAVIDNSGNAAIRQLTLTVVGPLSIVTQLMPNGGVGQPYSYALQAAGGTPPYVWSNGSLPGGLTLDPQSGVISSSLLDDPMLVSPGYWSFPLQVEDSGTPPQHANATVALGVSPPPPLLITTPFLPGAWVGQRPYSVTLRATGGLPPYSWGLGVRPPGGGAVSLSPNGVLTLDPLFIANKLPLTIQATDSSGSPVPATKTFTLLWSEARIAAIANAITGAPLPRTIAPPRSLQPGRIAVVWIQAIDRHRIPIPAARLKISFQTTAPGGRGAGSASVSHVALNARPLLVTTDPGNGRLEITYTAPVAARPGVTDTIVISAPNIVVHLSYSP